VITVVLLLSQLVDHHSLRSARRSLIVSQSQTDQNIILLFCLLLELGYFCVMILHYGGYQRWSSIFDLLPIPPKFAPYIAICQIVTRFTRAPSHKLEWRSSPTGLFVCLPVSRISWITQKSVAEIS